MSAFFSLLIRLSGLSEILRIKPLQYIGKSLTSMYVVHHYEISSCAN
jgi:hypothetical protein